MFAHHITDCLMLPEIQLEMSQPFCQRIIDTKRESGEIRVRLTVMKTVGSSSQQRKSNSGQANRDITCLTIVD